MNPPAPNISVPASLIGEPTRAAILMLLCDGRAHAAGALAGALQISAQSASNHLALLVDGGLLVGVRQGRHRYYQLASPEVAHAVEALAAVTPVPSQRLRSGRAGRELLLARRCYRHLAGRLGVGLLQALEQKGYLVRAGARSTGSALFALTSAGERWALAQGLCLPSSRGEGFAFACIDWTERREHLAGTLGNALLHLFEGQGYVAAGPGRALRLTPGGELFLWQAFDLELPADSLAQDH